MPSQDLASRLRDLRTGAGLTGVQLAKSLAWVRSKISKVENGIQIPSEQDIRDWTAATGHPEVADELIVMVRQVREHTLWQRRNKDEGQPAIQQELSELERAATQIRELQVGMIPGLLQTHGYAHGIYTQVSAVYEGVDIDQAASARIARQQILYEPGNPRRFAFMFPESVLYMRPCPRDVMLGQLDRLMAMDLSSIWIIPLGAQLSMSPLNSFLMLDDLVVIESYGYEDRFGGDLAATHARIFDMLMSESATGEDARRLIAKAAQSLRNE